MRHYNTDESLSGEHYAAGINGNNTCVLLQVGSKYGEQARAQLSATDARHCAALLLEAAALLENGDLEAAKPTQQGSASSGSDAYAEPM